jgi:hypothetical protein
LRGGDGAGVVADAAAGVEAGLTGKEERGGGGGGDVKDEGESEGGGGEEGQGGEEDLWDGQIRDCVRRKDR